MQSSSHANDKVEPWRLDRSSFSVAIDQITPQIARFLTKAADGSQRATERKRSGAPPASLKNGGALVSAR
jgi:hypothetical protein